MASSTFVIAIAGHSGAGKSTVIENLVSQFGNVNALSLDEYAASSIYPSTAKWIEEGADPNEFQTPQFINDIVELKNGKEIAHPIAGKAINPKHFLIIEEPFGRERDVLHDLIDFVVYLNRPLDVAYARKLARKSKFLPWEDAPEIFIANLSQNLEWYLSIGREFYLAIASRVRQNCYLVVDAMLPTEITPNQIVTAINGR